MDENIIKELSRELDEDTIVPDTSVIIEGLVSKLVESGELLNKKIVIHRAVISELEHQANNKRPTGFIGIDEIKELNKLEKEGKISVRFEGERPSPSAIKYAKSGEVDAIIRDLAATLGATLLTADKVQGEIAKALGVRTKIIEFEKKVGKLKIEKFFDDETMSVHLKENTTPKAKKGKPGEWVFVEIGQRKISKDKMEEMTKEIVEKANMDENSFIEIDKKGFTIVQFRNYRIVMTQPPLSDGFEITAVRPVKILSLEDYNIDEKLYKRLRDKAEGILVAGAPGNGKSTFCQALARFYMNNNKIVKTVEAPRDLILPPEITQYSKNKASNADIHDILLLSRPDYTVFDEIRNSADFDLFKDMRLSGVGMIGVVHATNPIDAIQRFIGRVELGMVPSIIDTVIYIEKGQIERVLEVGITVRVPTGMTEEDLARPIVEVKDFKTGELVYEMYSFGEQTAVVPVKSIKKTHSVAREIAKEVIADRIKKELPYGIPIYVNMPSENSVDVIVPKKYIPQIIGKKGANIEKLEKKVGVKIQVKEMPEELEKEEKNKVDFNIKFGKKSITIDLAPELSGRNVDIYIGNEYLMTATASKRGRIKIMNKSEVGRRLINAYNNKEEIEVRI